MAKYAVINDGVVGNIVLSESALEDNWFLVGDDVSVGMVVDGDSYRPPSPSEENQRYVRDAMLKDFVDPKAQHVLKWNSMSEDKKLEWTNYRQALLDVPQQEGFPDAITWPTLPEE